MNPVLEEEEGEPAVALAPEDEALADFLPPGLEGKVEGENGQEEEEGPDAAPSLSPRLQSPPASDSEQHEPATHDFDGAWFEPEDVLVMKKEGQQPSLRQQGDWDLIEAGLHPLSFDLHCQIGHERERQRHEERQMVFNARQYAEGLQSTMRVRQLVGQVSSKEHLFVQSPKFRPEVPLPVQPEVEEKVEEEAPSLQPIPAPPKLTTAQELPVQAPSELKPWIVPTATDPTKPPAKPPPKEPTPKEPTLPAKIPFQNYARRMSEVGEKFSRKSSMSSDIGPPFERRISSINVDGPPDDNCKISSKVDVNRSGVAPNIGRKGGRPSISNKLPISKKQPSLQVGHASLDDKSRPPELLEHNPQVLPKSLGPPPMAQQPGLLVSPAPITTHQQGHHWESAVPPPHNSYHWESTALPTQQPGLITYPAPLTQQQGHGAHAPAPVAKPQGQWISPLSTSAPQSKRQTEVGKGSVLFDIREKPQSTYERPQPLHWWGNPRQSFNGHHNKTNALEDHQPGTDAGLLSSKSFSSPRQNKLVATSQGPASVPNLQLPPSNVSSNSNTRSSANGGPVAALQSPTSAPNLQLPPGNLNSSSNIRASANCVPVPALQSPTSAPNLQLSPGNIRASANAGPVPALQSPTSAPNLQLPPGNVSSNSNTRSTATGGAVAALQSPTSAPNLQLTPSNSKSVSSTSSNSNMRASATGGAVAALQGPTSAPNLQLTPSNSKSVSSTSSNSNMRASATGGAAAALQSPGSAPNLQHTPSNSKSVSSSSNSGPLPMVGHFTQRAQLQEQQGPQAMHHHHTAPSPYHYHTIPSPYDVHTIQMERQAWATAGAMRTRTRDFLQLPNGHVRGPRGSPLARICGWDPHPQLRGLGLGHQQGLGSDGMGFVVGSRARLDGRLGNRPLATAPEKLERDRKGGEEHISRADGIKVVEGGSGALDGRLASRPPATAPGKISQEMQWREGLGSVAKVEGSKVEEGGSGAVDGRSSGRPPASAPPATAPLDKASQEMVWREGQGSVGRVEGSKVVERGSGGLDGCSNGRPPATAPPETAPPATAPPAIAPPGKANQEVLWREGLGSIVRAEGSEVLERNELGLAKPLAISPPATAPPAAAPPATATPEKARQEVLWAEGLGSVGRVERIEVVRGELGALEGNGQGETKPLATALEKASQEVLLHGGLGSIVRAVSSEAEEDGLGVLEQVGHGEGEQQQREVELAARSGGVEESRRGDGGAGGKDEDGDSKGSGDGSGKDEPGEGDKGDGMGEDMEGSVGKVAANVESTVAVSDKPREDENEEGLCSASAEQGPGDGQSGGVWPSMQSATVAASSDAIGDGRGEGGGAGDERGGDGAAFGDLDGAAAGDGHDGGNANAGDGHGGGNADAWDGCSGGGAAAAGDGRGDGAAAAEDGRGGGADAGDGRSGSAAAGDGQGGGAAAAVGDGHNGGGGAAAAGDGCGSGLDAADRSRGKDGRGLQSKREIASLRAANFSGTHDFGGSAWRAQAAAADAVAWGQVSLRVW
ncbi:hypothetical protein DUNSADRAFT_7972 [Dunaliella salina]|uniref:Uncharacterized protein n=1 Tax=Dunaliella salina TaxID=3046 RepID=A0ABQ7H631_DUNSA|nr:hypothetical protein DUNSADRAFT_7972 [Dunaliella salina]|eukprot:KAF5842319.1 hypothetical protein DUNSADRAFT_7972 [Dunaliella salina]